jgi:hypothetical protein
MHIFGVELSAGETIAFVSALISVSTTVIAVIAVVVSSRGLSKQLRIEQTPYVVIYGGIEEGKPVINIKNIGRGLAKNIEVFYNKDKKGALFTSVSSHTVDLGSGEKVVGREIDRGNWKNVPTRIENNSPAKFLYIVFHDQLGNEYVSECVLHEGGLGSFESGLHWKVMAHRDLK